MASYKGNQNHTFSHTSSTSPSPSSSSSQHKGLFPPVSYTQNQHHRGWLEGQRHVDETALRCYSGGGGGGSQLDFSLDARNDGGGGGGGEDDGDGDGIDDHGATRQGNSSEAQVDSGGGVGGQVVVEREHMFDKVVTPSDVGKLNRLVIPKQHAEKYFPLHSSTNEKGLLLNFEDRNGKPWRFRYSYWNSSQSYVMTKGWSRFVKEKKLDAGDIVSFQRGVGESGKDRLFIDWRRRPDAPIELPSTLPTFSFPHHFSFHHRTIYPWNQNNPLYLQPQPAARDYSHLLQPNPNSYGYSNSPYSQNAMGNSIPSVIYFRSAAATAAVDPPQAGMVQMQRSGSGVEHPILLESMPVVHGKAAAKRLRLFGVNMECPISDSDECDILSSTTTTIMPHSSTPTVAMAMSPHPNPPHSHLPHPYSSSSSNSSFVPSLQLKPYNGTPPPSMPPDLLNKGKSSMSLDLDLDM